MPTSVIMVTITSLPEAELDSDEVAKAIAMGVMGAADRMVGIHPNVRINTRVINNSGSHIIDTQAKKQE